MDYIKSNENPEFIKIAYNINIKKENIILQNLFNYLTDNIKLE